MDKMLQSDNFYEKFWDKTQHKLEYAFDAAVRDRFPAIQKVWGELILPNTVLDFGCGNGVLTYWLFLNGFGKQINGVDISHTGITKAQRAFRNPNISFDTLEALDNFLPNSFDVVVSSHVLEHIENPELALEKIASKSQWLILEVPLEKCIWPSISAFVRRKDRKNNIAGHVNFWNKSDFKIFLKESNLLVVRDYQYASAPYSTYNHWAKRLIERLVLKVLGINLYGLIMATHYTVLVMKIPDVTSHE